MTPGGSPRGLRVWHVSSNRWNSAITEYALSAARALEMAGHHSIVTPLVGSPAEARARAYGLETRPLPHFGPGALGVAAELAQSVRADVVVAYGGPETQLFRSKRLRGEAMLVRFRGQDVEPRFLGGIRHRLAHAHVDLLLAPSDVIAAKLKRLGHDSLPVASVVLGCDEAKFARVESVTNKERPEIVILGRLDPVKGHVAAMRLLRLILDDAAVNGLRPKLHIVGEPANVSVSELEAAARDLDLVLGDDVVITATRVEGIAALLSAAAIGLVPSLGSEIICRVAEEFLLCGTPVVVSGVGSLDEVLAFDGAGASYGGLDDKRSAALIAIWVAASVKESAAEKALRAEAARAAFSLATMGGALSKLMTKA